MAENEQAAAAIEQAAKIGIGVSYVSGFTVLTKSPRSEPRSDDEAATDQDVIEELGRNMREVSRCAAARARGVRCKDFLGKECFLPRDQIVGVLTGCTADGTVTVAYPGFNTERADSKLNRSGPGDELLIIVDGDQQPEASSSVLAPWISSEKLRVQIEDAEALGLRLEYVDDLLVVKWPAQETERAIVVAAIRSLGRSLRDLRAHMIARARGISGEFVGRQCFLPDVHAIGILESVSGDGGLEVSYWDTSMQFASKRTCCFNGDSLLVIVGEEAAQVSSADQKAEASWRKLLRRAFRA